MSRFLLSTHALRDLDEIIAYVQALPEKPGTRLGSELQRTLYDLAAHPEHGQIHEQYSLLAGEEIRRCVSEDYLFFYSSRRLPLVFSGILHGARDIDAIMHERLS